MNVVISGAFKILDGYFPTWLKCAILVPIIIRQWHSAVIVLVLAYNAIPYLIAFIFTCIHLFHDKDFADMINYYNRDGYAAFVAEVKGKDGSTYIAGMVGVAEADVKKKGFFHGLRQEGDAEMKRLCILEKYRGLKISKLLFQEVVQFCKKHGYKRMMLTTSSVQEVAYKHLYPGLGFNVDKTHHQPVFDVFFFSKKLE